MLVRATVFLWFFIGGIGHFAVPEYFLKIVPPNLPWRLDAVYISGLFELIGAFGLLRPKWRRLAVLGLITLTIAVTPANLYMLTHYQLFPTIPVLLLWFRLPLQVGLIWAIWWSTLFTKADSH